MRYFLLAVALLALPVLSACSPKPPAGPTLRVGTEANYKPFEYLAGADNFEGFDMDLMRAIGRELGMTVQFQNSSFDGLIPGLQAEKYDAIISCVTITPQRALQVEFSDPYYDAGQIVAVRADETRIHKKEDLKGHKVGAQGGTTGFEQAKASGAEVKSYESIDLAFQDLANGQIDAIVNDEPVSRVLVAKSKGFKLVGDIFTAEQYGIAVRKGNTALRDRINEALKKIRASGEWTKLQEKWITKPQ